MNKQRQYLLVNRVARGLIGSLLIATNLSVYANRDNAPSVATSLDFRQAIKSAQQYDPWLTGNRFQQQAINELAIADGSYADPKINIGLGNIAADSFDFNQEPMSQFKIGIAQVLPRGDTLSLKQQQRQLQSQQFPYLRENRRAQVAVTVGTLWLNAYRAQHCIALIEENRGLFEQLAQIAQASYSSAIGKTRQQDIVRAQLELTKIEDRLATLNRQLSAYKGQLAQWLLAEKYDLFSLTLSESLPQIELMAPALLDALNENEQGMQWQYSQKVTARIKQHPSVLAIDKKIAATGVGISIAKEKYKPQWAVKADYGYRADDLAGNERADLFSVGISFDVPLFTENRQDRNVNAAVAQTESIKTEKQLQIRALQASLFSSYGQLTQVIKRRDLFASRLLPQMHDQAEASLTAYTHDDGDFSEVVRARIAELNAIIDAFSLDVEQQILHLQINYLLVNATAGSQQQQQSHQDDTGIKP